MTKSTNSHEKSSSDVSIVQVMSQDSDFSRMSVRLSMLVLFTVLTGKQAHTHAHMQAHARARAHTHTHTHTTHTTHTQKCKHATFTQRGSSGA